MGPLVPDIIGNDLNYIVALIIGILFGMVLEQAGFSTSKKLVGLFYGYDFTVLRVFFTAGITAMVGVIALNHFGLLDINLIYINPTYLWSALVGGIIMGLGFVIGGFCPGTSVCAAAIGKIDAMYFVLGSLLGVLVFAEGYPLFEGLYKAEFWGNVRIFETLGMSQSIFATLMVLIAIFSFWFVTKIEHKVNKTKPEKFKFSPYYISLTTVALILVISPLVMPDRRESLLNEANDKDKLLINEINKITPDELALRIIRGDNTLQLIDFRPQEEFSKFALPKSIHFTFDNFFEKDALKQLRIKGKNNIIITKDENEAVKMAYIAFKLGIKNISILDGGMNNFAESILDKNSIEKTKNLVNNDTFEFRLKASNIIPILVEQNKSSGTIQKKSKRALGGC